MRISTALAFAVLAAVASPAHAVAWHAMRMDKGVILSVDTDSIKKNGDEAAFRYLVDYRVPQGEDSGGTVRYRSVVTYATFNCKARTMSLGRSDAYGALGAAGTVIARTSPTKAETAFKPLEKASSDEDLFRYVCQGVTKPVAPPAAAPKAAPKEAPKGAAPKTEAPKK